MCRSKSAVNKEKKKDNDDNITIRPYEPCDEQQVKDLFRAGIMSTADPAFFWICRNNPSINMVLVAGSVGGIGAAAVGGSFQVVFAGPLLVLASLALVVGILLLYHANRNFFRDYCAKSIQDDLSNIPQVYHCFLVAVDNNADDEFPSDNGGTNESNNKHNIVGMVGLEAKGGDTTNLYELRRMSVACHRQGQGLGRRLVQSIQKECLPGSKIILSTTNIQYSAHALYRNCGFVLTNKLPLANEGFQQYWFNLQLWVFEKDL